MFWIGHGWALTAVGCLLVIVIVWGLVFNRACNKADGIKNCNIILLTGIVIVVAFVVGADLLRDWQVKKEISTDAWVWYLEKDEITDKESYDLDSYEIEVNITRNTVTLHEKGDRIVKI